jgi:hypothetical protein
MGFPATLCPRRQAFILVKPLLDVPLIVEDDSRSLQLE